ncbi:MAG: F0F1 ATP synthase subunit gamma, partial [Oscillospiraceae bacterium]|nr:F0F1 ATP synthase subunit gamma [Oscillospiraceae bacterium]
MANLRAIRTRIKSVENTRQITKSMKMVAAAKLRKTQAAFLSLRAYAERSGDILRQIGGELTAQGSPDGANGVPKTSADASARQDEESVPQGADRWILPRGETRTVCYVLLVGNRGLCGTYNQALLRYCENIINSSDKQSYVICCGRWGKDLIASAG